MAQVIRVTGAWTGLLTDWLDKEHLVAADLRAVLARWAEEDIVPIPVWQELLARTVALRPTQPVPALSIGALVQPRHIGVLGYLVLASRTMAEALFAYQRYERLFYGVDLAEVSIEGDQVELRWRPGPIMLGQLHDAVAIAALVTFMRRQVGEAPPPTQVTFVHAAPQSVLERGAYENFFQCPVLFGDSHTRVQFSASYLTFPMPHSDPGLRALLDRQAQALLMAVPDSDEFDRALQQMMLKLLPESAATLSRTAHELHLSIRTLQRRLDARRLTWQQLLDRTREQLARQYLGDQALTLSDIALLLGYSEQSAFTRAYRRWTGETPALTRRRVKR